MPSTGRTSGFSHQCRPSDRFLRLVFAHSRGPWPRLRLTPPLTCLNLISGDQPISLVEDSEHDLFFMRYAFREAGVKNRVVELHDGQEAIDYLSGKGEFSDRDRYPLPCLIITDPKICRYLPPW